MAGLVDRECARCHGVQFFVLEYEPQDWAASLIPALDAYPTDWHGNEKCRCQFTDTEREGLEIEVARDQAKEGGR